MPSISKPIVNIVQSTLSLKCKTQATVAVQVTSYAAGNYKLCLNLPNGIPCFFVTSFGTHSYSLCFPGKITTTGKVVTQNISFTIESDHPGNYNFSISATLVDAAGLHASDSVSTQIQC